MQQDAAQRSAFNRQTRGSCTSVPQILVHCSQMIQSWLVCAKARQRSQFQSFGKASAFNSPNVEKSTARSCASQSADKSHPAGHYAVPLDIARFASIRYSVLSSSKVLSRLDCSTSFYCPVPHIIASYFADGFQLEHPLLLFTHSVLPQELPRAVDFKDVEDNPHSWCLICWLANRTQVQTSPRSNWRTDD